LVHDSGFDKVHWLPDHRGEEACEEAACEVAPDIVLHQPVLENGLLNLVVARKNEK
jgi:hypothetical protein